MAETSRTRTGSDSETARAIRTVAIVTLVLIIAVQILDVLLLAFAGILLAVILSGAANAVAGRTSIPRGAALAGTVVALVVIVGLGIWALAPQVIEQSRQLLEEVPRALKELDDRYGSWLGGDVYKRVAEKIENPGQDSVRSVLSGFFGAVSGTIGFLGSALLIVVLGLYLAARPQTYRNGAMALVPLRHRGRAAKLSDDIADKLLWWVIGKLIEMVLVGIVTFIGLWLWGIPLAVTLALIAAALAFIPTFGPIVAVVPAILIAFGQGIESVVYVAVLYFAIQSVESYYVTPLIHQRTISLPPALTIIAQVVMGVFAGVMGLALATPLAAVVLVVVQKLYVEDTLKAKKTS